MTLREEMARAIYEAAFDPDSPDEDVRARRKPSPGWAWDKTSEEIRDYCRRQADFALVVVRRRRAEL